MRSATHLRQSGGVVLDPLDHELLEGRHLALIVFKADGFNFYDEEKIYTEPGTFRPVVVLRDFDLNVFGKGKIREEYLTGEGKIKVIKESGGKKEEQV
ncbi:hypothetical protein HYT95_02445, partial [Candidatus Peregrinibacteria bacterium]|nr:hypothetical protein [Candidatus Peregrinibacteria bacterium]